MIVTVQGTSLLRVALFFIFFLIAVFTLSGMLTSLKPELRITSASINHAADTIDGEALYRLMGWENHQFLQSLPETEKTIRLSSLAFELSTNISLDDPRSFLGRELPGFDLFDGKILVAGEGTNYTNMPIESAPPLEVLQAEQEAALKNTEDINTGEGSGGGSVAPPNSTGDQKVVYLYFSHNRESFLPYLEGVTNPDHAYHSQVNVTNIGDRLKESLVAKGIGTTVDKTDIMGQLNEKGLRFSQAYQESRGVVQEAMTGSRDLTYFIDIHRDSRRKKDTTITIDGESYAKLAFVIGGNNQNYEKNLKFASELHHLLEENYKGLSRGIIENKGAGMNGVYNQDLSQNVLLVEFGGVDNTFEELYRSADALADVFSEYYWQAEQVDAQLNH
ncbi:stage II sporulation protein P [Bacillus sp. B15-48]|nr:stage II sporulation protein P [Bacillus sp. B15-48]MBM4762353.1 stage II sporulation protein P [Bacillus sp. B15-48]